MYAIKRHLHTLKISVHNKAHPEGSMVEGHLAKKYLTFCSRYLVGIDIKLNRPPRNDDEHDDYPLNCSLDIFLLGGRPLGSPKQHYLNSEEKRQAHLYVLNNYEEVWPFIE